MHGMVNIAVRAARQAGAVMVRHLNQLEALAVTRLDVGSPLLFSAPLRGSRAALRVTCSSAAVISQMLGITQNSVRMLCS